MNQDTIYAAFDALRTYFLAKFDACAWSLSARLVGSSTSVSIPAEYASGLNKNWSLIIPAALTAELASGTYTLQLIASNGTTTMIAASESVKLYAANETDLRSDNRKMLDAMDAVLLGKASSDESSVSYNGRSLSRMSWDDLQTARARTARAVHSEEDRAAGRSKIKSVQMEFRP